MNSTSRDYSVFDKFNFERKPVGMKFLLNRPEGIDKLDKDMAFCAMFKEAQTRSPFYVSKDNFTCLGRILLGMEEAEPVMESGQIGATERIYEEARANRRIYQYIAKLAKNTVRYVAFSPVDALPFDPDILIVTASINQAEILLRALSYSTGKPLTSKITPVIMCSWMFVYPYVSGEMNYMVTGLGYGMKAQRLLPEGLMLISIPYDLLPMLTENLQEMDWVLKLHTLNDDERLEFQKSVMSEIRQKYENG
jgi:uncharacterized protein (DUF169 family)